MLERAIIVVDKVIVIIGVYKIIIILGEHKSRAHMKLRQLRIMWIFDNENFLTVVIEIFALLITEVRVGVSIADDFARPLHPNCAVVGRDDYTHATLCQPF